MNDYIIMSGIAHHFSDLEVADIANLFGDDPILSIIEDGTAKDRSRAIRRKKTAARHQRLDRVISSKYPVGIHKHGRKDLRRAKAWYSYDDLRKDTEAEEIAEAWEVATYLERKADFDRLVEAFLTVVDEEYEWITPDFSDLEPDLFEFV